MSIHQTFVKNADENQNNVIICATLAPTLSRRHSLKSRAVSVKTVISRRPKDLNDYKQEI